MMKQIRIVMVAVLAAAVFAAGCEKKKSEHFGEPFTAAPEVAIALLLEQPEAYRRQPVRIRGVIERQCPAAGCWLFLNDGQGRSIRVELGDYFPKLPRYAGGSAEVEGEIIAKGQSYEFIGTRISFFKETTP
ncbi:MAG: hypothetical protein NC924_08875 [Candidatus Omnitrophica bacterium]|nr:hypothetical protein [Candidatus Omnitrophota bacterium]